MNNSTDLKLPAFFWVVAVAAVIWNLLGVMAYIMQVTMSEEAFAALPEAQQALYAAQPAWVTGAFAIAVFAGLGASITLVLRKIIATAIFAVSLVAVIAQMYYVLVMSNMITVMGATSIIMPLLVLVFAIALVWFSVSAQYRGWISQ